jgi:hypothetical protein
MNTHDDDLRVRLGRIRNRGSHYKGFFAEVRSTARNEGYRSRSPRVSRLNRDKLTDLRQIGSVYLSISGVAGR